MDVAERELRQILRQASSTKQAKRRLAEFQATKKTLLPQIPKKLEDTPVAASTLPLSQWKAGDQVYLPLWRIQGQLISFDRKKALINCNGKQLHAEVSQVLHMDDQNKPKAVVSDHFESGIEQAVTFELNLLGFRVEDAVSEIDRQIDMALRRQSPFLRVIHGHGTGALKAGIREYLKSHPARNTFDLVIDPGNDGVTDLQFTS